MRGFFLLKSSHQPVRVRYPLHRKRFVGTEWSEGVSSAFFSILEYYSKPWKFSPKPEMVWSQKNCVVRDMFCTFIRFAIFSNCTTSQRSKICIHVSALGSFGSCTPQLCIRANVSTAYGKGVAGRTTWDAPYFHPWVSIGGIYKSTKLGTLQLGESICQRFVMPAGWSPLGSFGNGQISQRWTIPGKLCRCFCYFLLNVFVASSVLFLWGKRPKAVQLLFISMTKHATTAYSFTVAWRFVSSFSQLWIQHSTWHLGSGLRQVPSSKGPRNSATQLTLIVDVAVCSSRMFKFQTCRTLSNDV